MKPIHKFNNGDGATLCRNCRTIIFRGFIDALYCEKCKGYKNQKNSSDKEKK